MNRNKNNDFCNLHFLGLIFFSLSKKSTRIYGEIINPINDTIRIYNMIPFSQLF